MANNGRINFTVGFNVDQSGLTTLQNELRKITNLTKKQLEIDGVDVASNELKTLQKEAAELSNIFSKSYNFKLNSLDFEKLRTNLKQANINLADFSMRAKKVGPEAALSVNKLNTAIFKTQKQLQETTSWAKKLSDTFANTIRWTAASTAINTITGSIQKAWSFTKDLDSSLTNIRIVTEKSAEEMEKFAVKANNAAKALGASTKQYTDASLIYYQQGLSDSEVEARTSTTLKVANVTGMSARESSELLTAVWNGYKVSAQESEIYIDKLSKVAATTAADLEELSTGMSKVASAANIMGVDIDQLNAQLATIVSVTREAPESIGTALKTVYARMSDIQSGLDEETTLDEYTDQMASMGIYVLDAQNNLRDMGDIVEEIGEKWGTLNRNQQVSLAQTIAGTRQYSRMMALFDNWEMYESSKQVSQTSEGTLEKQQEKYLDSMEAKLQELTTSAEKFYMALFDNEGMKTLIEGLTKIVDLIGNITEGLGGGLTLLLGIGGGFIAKSGSIALGESIETGLKNRVNKRENKKQLQEREGIIQDHREELNAMQNPLAAIEKQQKILDDTEKELSKSRINGQIALEKYTEEQAKLSEIDTKLKKARWENNESEIQSLELAYKKQSAIVNKAKSEYEVETKNLNDIVKTRDAAVKARNRAQSYKDNGVDPERQASMQETVASQERELKIRKLLTQDEAQQRQKRLEDIDAANDRIALLHKEEEQIEKDKNEALAKLNDEQIANLEKFKKELEKKLKEIKEVKEAEAAQEELTTAEKDFAKREEEQDMALNTFKKFARKADGKPFHDETKFTYREGAQSGGRWIDPATAAQTLTSFQGELGIHEKALSGLSSGLTSGKTDILSADFASSMENEFSWLKEHQKQLDFTEREWTEVKEAYEKYQKALKEAKENPANEAAQEQARIAALGVTGAKGKQGVISNKLSNAKNETQAAIGALSGDNIKAYKKQQEQLKTIREKATQTQQKAEEKQNEQRTKELKDFTETAEKEAEKQTAAITEEAKEQTQEVNNNITKQENIIKEANEANLVQEQNAAFKVFGESIGQTTGGLLQMASAMTMLSQIPSIINNDDLTTGEKFLQILLTTIPAITAATSGFTSLTKGIGSLIQTFPTVISGLFGVSAAEVGTGTAGKVGKKGVDSLTKAMMSNPYLLIIGAIIMAIVASIAAMIAIIDKASEAYNKDAIAAQKAAERAEEAAKAYENVKKEYEQLKKSIADYQAAQNGIDHLIAGTDEWRNAIREANEQVMQMIQTYPELAKYLNNEGGRLTISQEGLDQLEKTKNAEVDAAYRESLTAKIRATEAKDKAAATALGQKTEYVDAGKIAGAAGSFRYAGASPLFGTAMIASYLVESISTGDWGHSFENELNSDQMQELMDFATKEGNEDIFSNGLKLQEALENSGNATLQAIAADENMINAIMENKDEMSSLASSISANNEINDALRKEIARSQLADNQVYNKYVDEIAQLEMPQRDDYKSLEAYSKALLEYDAKKGELTQKTSNIESYFASDAYDAVATQKAQTAIFGSGNDSIKDLDADDRIPILKSYWSKKLGIPESDIKIIRAGGDGYTIEFLKDGEWKSEGHDYTEEFDQELIDAEKSKQTIGEAEVKQFEAQFAKEFGQTSAAMQEAFSTFIGDGVGNFSVLTKEEFEKLSNTWKDVEWKDVKADPALYNDLKEKAQALGLGTSEEAIKQLYEGIINGINNYENQQEKIDKLFLHMGKEGVFRENSEFFNKLSQQQQTEIAQLWNKMALASSNGAQAATDVLSKLSEENFAIFNAALGAVDWTDADSIKEFSISMQEVLGITDPAVLEEFAFQMRYANGLIKKFDVNKAASDFVNLQEVIEAAGEDTKNISKEQYDSLSNEMQKYFIRMADGTYALKDVAEDFAQKAKEARRESLLSQAKEAIKNELTTFTDAFTLSDAEESAIVDSQKTKADEINALLETVDKIVSDAQMDQASVADRSNATTALGVIKRAGILTDAEINAYETAIESAGGLSDGEAKNLYKSLTDAKNKLSEEAKYIVSSEAIAAAQTQKIQEKMAAAGIKEGDAFKLSPETMELFNQLMSEETSLTGLNSIFQEIIKIPGFENLTQDQIDDIYEEYQSRFEYLQKQAENFKIEVDPFDQIDKKLKSIGNKLEKLQGIQENLTGAEYLENINAQNDALNQQIDALREKQALLAQETTKTKSKIEAKLAEAGISADAIQYNDDGTIANWEALMGAATSYWSSSYDEVAAQKYADDITDLYETFGEQLLETGPDLEQEIQDAINQIYKNNLQSFEYKLDLKLETTELKREFNNLKRELTVNSKDVTSIAESYLYDANTLITDINNIYDALNSISLAGLSDADAMEQQVELTQQLGEKLTEIKDNIDSISETWESSLDNIQEAYEKQIEYLEVVNALFEKQLELQELLYGEQSANSKTQYYATLRENAEKQEALAEQHYIKAYERYQEATADATKHLYTDEQRARLEEDLTTALESYSDSIVASATAIQEEYFNKVSSIIEDFNQEIAGTNKLSSLKEEWEWQKKINDGYYDSINAGFELEKLKLKFTKAMQNTSNIKIQEKINKLQQEELKILSSKEKLSESDVKYAEQKLAILQAEIALQDAQDAKTQMRLIRSQDGSYSYQYVADQAKILQAREQLLIANQDAHNLLVDASIQRMEQVFSLMEEFEPRILELLQQGASAEEIEAWTEKYMGAITQISEDSAGIRTELEKQVAKAAKDLEISTEDLIIGTTDVLNSNIAEVVDNIAVKGLDATFQHLKESLTITAKDYYDTISSKETALENLMSNKETGSIAMYKNLYDAQSIVYSQYQTEHDYIIDSLVPAVASLRSEYDKLAASIYTAYQNLITMKAEEGKAIVTDPSDVRIPVTTQSVTTNSQGNDTTKVDKPEAEQSFQYYLPSNVDDLPLYDYMGQNTFSQGPYSNDYRKALKKMAGRRVDGQYNAKTGIDYFGVGDVWFAITIAGETNYIRQKDLQIKKVSLDTGGYTGAWGSDGRMAMLHEKELVLNKHDTANFLEAIDIVRSLNMSMLGTLARLGAANTISGTQLQQLANSTIEQNVHISAEFPNVNSKEEIEAAFNDLINLAAQHAYKNTRS